MNPPEGYSRVLRTWYATYKSVLLYSPSHPSTVQACDKLTLTLKEVLQNKLEISIQHADGIFVIENFFFIEESLLMYDLLSALETCKVSSVVFLSGATSGEILSFLKGLLEKSPTLTGGNHLRVYQETQKSHVGSGSAPRSLAIKRVMTLYEEWVERTGSVFSKLLDEQTLPLSDLSHALEVLIDALQQSPAGFSMTVAMKEKSNLPVEHALHTMVLSLFLGQQAGLDPGALKSLGLAALLHDTGRFLLPSDFTTGHRLAPGDADFIQLHARDGASFLANVPGLPTTAARVALEHHLGFDGLGYPQLPASHKPHFFSQIVGLADFVSWGTVSDNFYHRPAPFYRLVRSLLRRSGSQFDPLLVKLLLPFLGIYPPGTELRLSDGSAALAVEPNLRNITRPSVVVRGHDGGWSFRWLAELPGAGGASFPLSVAKPLGQKWIEEAHVDLIPGETA